MFRTCLSSGSRILARPTAASAPIHTSAVSLSMQSKMNRLRIRKQNIKDTHLRAEEEAAHRPSIILGTRPGEEHKWAECTLAEVLVDEEALHATENMVVHKMPIGKVALPAHFAYGVEEAERHLLFGTLPDASTGMARAAAQTQAFASGRPSEWNSEQAAVQEATELRKANLFAKVLDLRNANAAGIAYENRRRIIREFSTPENPFNPGRTEVQVALLTYKIRNLWNHLNISKRDVGNRRSLSKFVHQRAKLLKYLKGVSLDRYDSILERLALEPESVEGELVL